MKQPSLSEIYSGSYTPTATVVTNVTSVTPELCYFNRVGDIVHVFGKFSIVPTDDVTNTSFRLTLPVVSDFTDERECAGTMNPITYTTSTLNGVVEGNIVNDAMLVKFKSDADANAVLSFEYNFTASYVIL